MTHLKFREQLVCDIVLAAEDRAINGRTIQDLPSCPTELKHKKHPTVNDAQFAQKTTKKP
jgi:hypothetical protein